jgi:hypothetical protein
MSAMDNNTANEVQPTNEESKPSTEGRQTAKLLENYTYKLKLPDGRLVTLQEFLDENPNLELVEKKENSILPKDT